MSKVDTTDEELAAAWATASDAAWGAASDAARAAARDAADRAWLLAGWHDSQMEKECQS